MYNFRFFSRIFGIEYNDPALYVAQYKNMARQTPWLYLIVITSTIAVSYVFWNTTPGFLSFIYPAILIAGDLGFLFWFIAKPKGVSQEADNFHALIRLHTTIWGSIGLGLAHAVWSIALFGYGDGVLKGLVAVFLATATFGASLCLMHLRLSATTLVVSIIGPLAIFLWMTGIAGYMAAALIITLVMVVFVYILNGYAGDFIQMVRQRKLLEAQRADAEKLSKTNFALANEDSLTGLPNRRSYLARLNAQVANLSLGQADGLAVGVLDLDGFKLINDVYGHPVGDLLLKKVGTRLNDLLCSRVFIARLGGDEFGILVKGALNGGELVELGEMICEAMTVPFEMEGLTARLGGSVGFATWNTIKDTAECLFEKADYALYHAKENARGGVVIFSEEHAATIKEVSGVDRRMQDADFEDEMSLVFQPIVATKSATTIGFEVLARWHSPIMGFISPDVFIRSAERAGTINRLTAVLLEKALLEAMKWPKDIFMSFNLSMQDITSAEAMLRLVTIIKSSGFDPKRITFEVTETSIMNDFERALESLNLLRSMGSKIALDDFGTGYSSLSYVRSLPLDKLKLDRSFITEIEEDEDAVAIVHTMIDLCASLKVDCIIEGVETRGQLGILNALGGQIIQGYYFSKPLKAQQALAYINAEREVELAS